MNPLRSILVATDLSAHAERASRRGALLAEQHGSSLELLLVTDEAAWQRVDQGFGPLAGGLSRTWQDTVKGELEALVEHLREHSAIEVTTSLRTGRPTREIADAARSADLLILGAQGEHPWRDLFIGTTADRLLRKAPCPMLVTKHAPLRRYERVLVPVELDATRDSAALRAALVIAPDAQFVMVHATDFPFEGKMDLAGVPQIEIDRYRDGVRVRAREQLEATVAACAGAAGRSVVIVAAGDPGRVVADEAVTAEADLVVMFKQGQSVVEELFLGSVTRHVLSEARCDVLVLPRATEV
ncbi:Universal stress protein E [Gammaproteobacteria bacterium]|nr:Universal stress protein E [Gammaproteobacteria bacterium]